MIISIKEFIDYTGTHVDDTSLLEKYILSSQDIINNYLSYNVEEKIFNPKTCLIEDTIDIPEIVKMTCLRIASILEAESNGNIAISSKSFGESGSRQYINYTNFDKYLLQISSYRLMRI
ncbi:MAG: hypothetical protein FWH54_06515 [Methanobrevibacter sp.]|nr:hypothetical protein [Methanobrevibacter sp.]